MAKIGRDNSTGRFVIGRKAFEKVSSVEDIRPSKALLCDLKKLAHVSDAERRTIIGQKYGGSKSGQNVKPDAESGRFMDVEQGGRPSRGLRRGK